MRWGDKCHKAIFQVNFKRFLVIFKSLIFIKFFSNYFKIGYFKSIHTVGLDFFRSIDNLNTNTLANLIINNAIFAVINQSILDVFKFLKLKIFI